MSFASRLSRSRAGVDARRDHVFFRRAVGFTIKIDDRIRVRDLVLTEAELRAWMALSTFQRWYGDAALLDKLEANDLVYWSETPGGRATTGTPLGRAEGLTLRDGVGVTVALSDGDEIASWPFMARRGELDTKRFHGLRFSSAERGQEVYSVDFYRPEVRYRLHPLMDACALLGDPPRPPAYPEAYVMWLGHAAVVVRVGDATILVDPLFMRRSDPPKAYVQQAFDWRLLPRIDAIAITHADNDHFNPGTLARLDPNIPIIVPPLAKKQPYQVDMERALQLLDFRKVVVGSTQIGNVRITAEPFRGEDWGLQLQQATYLIEGPRGRVYLSADCLDSDFDRIGPVDFAFLGVSGCEEPLIAPPGFGYGEFYADWLSHARRNEWQRFTMGPRDAAEAARRLRAKRVFGYAAGGGSFMDMAHADEGTHALLAAQLPEVATDLSLGVPFPLC